MLRYYAVRTDPKIDYQNVASSHIVSHAIQIPVSGAIARSELSDNRFPMPSVRISPGNPPSKM